MLALAFLGVCTDSCACACTSLCLYGLLGLRLRFSVFVWTLVFALALFGVCKLSCVFFPMVVYR